MNLLQCPNDIGPGFQGKVGQAIHRQQAEQSIPVIRTLQPIMKIPYQRIDVQLSQDGVKGPCRCCFQQFQNARLIPPAGPSPLQFPDLADDILWGHGTEDPFHE